MWIMNEFGGPYRDGLIAETVAEAPPTSTDLPPLDGTILKTYNRWFGKSILVAALTFSALVVAPPTASAQQTTHWLEMGRSGLWIEFNAGLRSRDLFTVAVDPETPARVYAAGDGALFRSLDGGETFETVVTIFASRSEASAGASSGGASLADIESLTDDQIDAVDDRFQELEQDLFQQVSQDTDEFTAALIVESSQDELLEQALEDVLAELRDEQGAESSFVLPEEIPENRFTLVRVDPRDTSRVYAASGRGLFFSSNYGATWEQLFRGVGEDNRRVVAVALTDDTIVLGTAGGLHVSEDAGATWRRPIGGPGEDPVRFVVEAPSHTARVYASAGGRIYRSDDSGISFSPAALPSGLGEGDLGNLAVDASDPDTVFLASREGVWRSDDAAASFDRLNVVGLRAREVLWVLPIEEERLLFVGTIDGLYVYNEDARRWDESSEGLTAVVIQQIVATSDGHLWAATEEGLFQLFPEEDIEPRQEMASRAVESWALEPDIGQTVEAALEYYTYRELDWDAWRMRINWRRVLPLIRSSITFFTTDRQTETYVPGLGGLPVLSTQDFSSQDDFEYRVLFSWDLENLLINRTEFSARDVTDRLVTRRNALVRRVIRVFDQRRDLIVRMITRSRTTTEHSLEDAIRLQELTARLDIYTGGFFSAYAGMGTP